MASIAEYRRKVEQLKGQKSLVEQTLAVRTKALQNFQEQLLYAQKAQAILQKVGLDTQSKLEDHIANLVSMALAAVFDDPYQFSVKFVQRRGKTECDLKFVRNGQEVEPLEASGVGAVDIATLALRVALWALQKERTRNTLVLDEPMKHLSKDLHPRASVMIKEISDMMGLQVIMVTHSEDLVESADKIFHVKLVNGISQVTTEVQ